MNAGQKLPIPAPQSFSARRIVPEDTLSFPTTRTFHTKQEENISAARQASAPASRPYRGRSRRSVTGAPQGRVSVTSHWHRSTMAASVSASRRRTFTRMVKASRFSTPQNSRFRAAQALSTLSGNAPRNSSRTQPRR